MPSILNTAREYPVRPLLQRATLLAVLWWILTEGSAVAWGAGLISVMLALLASLMLLPPGPARLSPAGLAGFLGFFLLQSVKGGVQVAVMALRPGLDLHPAMLEMPMRLPEGQARVLLANTLNLLPGTLSAGLDHNQLRLHVLDERQPIEAEVREVERRIARMLGLPMEAS